jgi:Carboxypeptidase regulatory-like domain
MFLPHPNVLISGVVLEPDGKPAPLARLYFVSGPRPLPDIAALTDANGSFSLSVSTPGTYELECLLDGFAPKRVTIKVSGQQQINLRIMLSY